VFRQGRLDRRPVDTDDRIAAIMDGHLHNAPHERAADGDQSHEHREQPHHGRGLWRKPPLSAASVPHAISTGHLDAAGEQGRADA
jgi:hypothetical protein